MSQTRSPMRLRVQAALFYIRSAMGAGVANGRVQMMQINIGDHVSPRAGWLAVPNNLRDQIRWRAPTLSALRVKLPVPIPISAPCRAGDRSRPSERWFAVGQL